METPVQTIIFDIILTALLIGAGYISVCCRLQDCPLKAVNKALLKLTTNRTIYLLLAVLSCDALIAVFVLKYDIPMLQQLKLLCLMLVIFPCAAVDFKTNMIPNEFLLSGIFLWVPFLFFGILTSEDPLPDLLSSLLAAAAIGIFFLLLYFIFKNSIGMGDIKLFALMGLYLGLSGVLSAVFFSLLASFCVAVFCLITKKKSRKDSFAFCPCILIGTLASLLLGGM